MQVNWFCLFRTLLGIKILGFPVRIYDKKYARNAFHFNVCFICDSWARTVHYEPVVKKLTDFLVGMEKETNFLSALDRNGDIMRLTDMLRKVMDDLNSSRMCNLTGKVGIWFCGFLLTFRGKRNDAFESRANSHGSAIRSRPPSADFRGKPQSFRQ